MEAPVDFLAAVMQTRRKRLAAARTGMPLDRLRAAADETRAKVAHHALRNALCNDRTINVIAEIKRASPSKGDLGSDAKVDEVARAYERGGAVAVSVLTEEDHFRGSLADLLLVREVVSLPVLRKDFIFDEYQVYESAAAGADALLLIVNLLDARQLAKLRKLTEDELKMDAVVEVHSRDEMIQASEAGATLIGVNNRNLHTFEVSLDISFELARERRGEAVLISESGLSSGAQLKRLRAVGYRGFLIGEKLITAKCPEHDLRSIIRDAEE